MTPSDQKYFETLVDLFTHEGWHLIIAETKDAVNTIEKNGIRGANSVEDLFRLKGRLDVLEALLGKEETVRMVMEAAEVESNAKEA